MTEESTIALTHHEIEGAEYLTFSIGEEDYGIDILKVQEIRGWEPVTRIPNAPDYIQGVLNLRGAIVPVYDLRRRLGMPFLEYGKETVVIVVRLHGREGNKSIGVVVDAVSNVMRATTEEIRKAPDFGARLDTDFITGMTTVGDKMIMLLDVDRLQYDGALDEAAEVSAA